LALAVHAAGEAGPPACGGTLESFAASAAAAGEDAPLVEAGGGFFGKLGPSLIAARRARESPADPDDAPRSQFGRMFH
jgi:hypothetical protein